MLQVFNSSNTIVAEYTYDSWGNILSATGTQASVNPFRYRGYYYDEETGFYWLSSRYYDPEVGRFINADVFASTGQSIIGFNMFAYCLNDSVNRVDFSGNMGVKISGTLTRELRIQDEGIGGAIGAISASGNALSIIAGIGVGVAAAKAIEKEEERADAIPITLAETQKAQYYGAEVSGGELQFVTGPMDYVEAFAWALTTGIFRGYNKNDPWGMYTPNQQDALNMAIALGGPIPIIHTDRIGEFPHYHVTGFDFLKRYKHFHIWYGVEYGG